MKFQLIKIMQARGVLLQESGAYLVLATSVVVALLFLTGLAIDSARLYLTKRELQTAVDAATIGGSNLIVTRPDLQIVGAGSPGAPTVESMTRDLLRSNLLRMGFDPANAETAASQANICFGDPDLLASSCPSPALSPESGIKLSANIVQPTLIIGLLPGMAQQNSVNSSSIVSNLRLRAALVLDDSYSMGNPLPAAPQDCAADQSRMCGVKYASSKFMDISLPFDRIGGVKFSTNYAFGGSSSGYCAIDAHPLSSTTPDSVFYDNMMNDAAPLASLAPAGIHGVNLTRLRRNVSSMVPLANTDIGAGIRTATNLLLDPALGPVQKNELLVMVLVTDGAPFLDCGPVAAWKPYFLTRDDGIGPQDRRIENMCSRYLNQPQNDLGKFQGFGADSYETARRLNFIDSIQAADEARERGITIFTIGVGGTNDTDPEYLNSPFQDTSDTQHPVLLWRLANDQGRMRSPPILPNSGSWTPYSQDYKWDFPCVMSGNDLRSKPNGHYYNVTDGAQLTSAFEDIAGTIRNKLAR